MIETLLALLLGMFLAYILGRSLGLFIPITILLCVRVEGQVTVHFTASGCASCGNNQLYFGTVNPPVTFCTSLGTGSGSTVPACSPHPTLTTYWMMTSPTAGNGAVVSTAPGATDVFVAVDCGTACAGGPNTNVYVWSGCITNTSAFPYRYTLTCNVGAPTTVVLGAGEVFCTSIGQTSPFFCGWSWDSLNPEFPGGGIGPGTDAGTNTTGGGGGGGPIAPTPPAPPGNNPTNTGGGNTNGLTGDQFANGVRALQDTMWGVGNFLGGLIGTNGLNVTNVAGTNVAGDLAWTNLLVAATNDATRAFNLVSSLNGLTNQFLPNGYGFMTGTVANGAVTLGNGIRGSFDSNGVAGLITNVQDLNIVGASNVWEIPVNIHLASAPLSMDLNPRKNKAWALAVWVRLVEVWVLVFWALRHVHKKSTEMITSIGSVPGSDPTKSSPVGWFTWALRYTVFTTVLAGIPIIVAAAIASIIGSAGLGAGPMSTSIVATLGNSYGSIADAVFEALRMTDEWFPLGFGLVLFGYIWAFDLAMLAFHGTAVVLIRNLT